MDLEAINTRLAGTGLRAVEIDENANRPIQANEFPYTWQDLHHPMLESIAMRYRLAEVIAPARSEFEQLLLLRHWVYRNIPQGWPTQNLDEPWLLGDFARSGNTFYCTHYSWLLMYVATAMGWPARHIGIDRDHDEGQRSTHHGVCDVFCYELDKWIVFDTMYDLHYESDDIPLSVLEIRNTFLEKGSAAMVKAIGPQRSKVRPSDQALPGYDQPACYFWFYINSRNNHFTQPAWQDNEKLLLYIDDRNRNRKWYQNEYDEAGNFVRSRLHTGYLKGKFQPTERIADILPPLGSTHIQIDPSQTRPADTAVLPVVFHTINPYWDGFEVRFDEAGPWVPVSRRIDWRLHEGPNVVEARLVTLAGHRGQPARLTLHLCRRHDADQARH